MPVPATSAPRWRDLGIRLLSAAVLAPIVLMALWLGGTAWNVLIALLTVGMLLEFFTLSRRNGAPVWRVPVQIILGLFYILPAAWALVWLRADPQAGRANVLFIVLVVWASDIGAYLFGRLIGGRRLAPAISPSKTWSGAVGGLACALAVGTAAALIQPVAANISHAALVAGLLAIIAQIGDLLESALKRHFGVKDSGYLLPGHGGLLDRLDAVLTAAPAAALLAWLAGEGAYFWQ